MLLFRSLAQGTALAAVLCACPFAAHAADVEPYEEYAQHLRAAQQVTPLTSTEFGDQTALYNQSTEFDVTDIDVPGNNALPVRLGRRFEIADWRGQGQRVGGFGEWDMDVPYMEGVFLQSAGWQVATASPNSRCTQPALPNTQSPSFGLIPPDLIWDGYQMYMPGEGAQELLVNSQTQLPGITDGNTYPWITKNYTRLTCLSATANGMPGEAFLAVSPDGVKTWFNYEVVKFFPNLKWIQGFASDGFDGYVLQQVLVPRSKVFMLATRQQDRFGNWVNYSYGTDANGNTILTGITSSDNRTITPTWTNGVITSATSSVGNWSYGYTTVTDTPVLSHVSLNTVTRPDGSQWTYTESGTLVSTKMANDPTSPPAFLCQIDPDPNTGTFNYTVTAPFGASAAYAFNYHRHYRDYVPYGCPKDQNPYHDYPNLQFDFVDNYSLLSKQVTGPGLAPQTWTYSETNASTGTYYYATSVQGPDNANPQLYVPPPDCTYCALSKLVTVVGPTHTDKYTFGVQYARNEGRLLATETDSPTGTVLKTSSNTYLPDAAVAAQPFPGYAGSNLAAYWKNPMTAWIRPVQVAATVQGGVTFSATTSSWDVFANPASITRARSLGYSKTDSTTYATNTANWVIDQVATVTDVGTGLVMTQNAYDPSTAMLTSTQAFGLTQKTLTYNADGTLKTVADGDGHTTTLANFNRGVPQSVAFADGTSETAVVNGAGWITSLTVPIGATTADTTTTATTSYGYDPMGRINQITYPSSDTVVWTPTTISFAPVNGVEFGLPAGHWKQIVTTGGSTTQETAAIQSSAAARSILLAYHPIAGSGSTSQGACSNTAPLVGGITPPTVTLTSPASGSAYAAPASIALGVATTPGAESGCSDPVSTVTYYDGGTAINPTPLVSPFTMTWTSATVGAHTLTAIATDGAGVTATSSAVAITVTGTSTPPPPPPPPPPASPSSYSVTYYDALLRPVVGQEYDGANPTATMRFTTKTFDADDHTTFSSYPVAGIVNYNDTLNGVQTTYDGLGRPTASVQASELGPLATSYSYLTGFQTQVTNPRNYATTTSYQVFDSPDTSHPVTIASPLGVTTGIARDVFGKPLTLTRSGTWNGAPISETRSYVYDANQRLCKRVEPETGATLMNYDNADNVLWTATASTFTATTTCNNTTAPANAITHTYDLRNRPLTETVPGSTSIGYSYFNDGELHTLTSGSNSWRYVWNRRRLPQTEQLSIDGRTETITHGYDALGHENSLTYPSGLVITTAPNGLGQPTQVAGATSYASGISYFPNGGMSGFTYGNGSVHSLTQNTRELPLRSLDVKAGAAEILDDTYAYDPNGNVASITDGTGNNADSRTMAYDALDRLTGTAAPGQPWISASTTYDPLDNIRTNAVGSRSYTYTYNPTTFQLSQLTSTTAAAMTLGYDANSNIASKGAGFDSYTFDVANRMQSVTGKEAYVYDGYGRRVKITTTGGPNIGKLDYPVYTMSGQLLTEDDQRANTTTDYISLNGSLVAKNVATLGTTNYAATYEHTDALRSPVTETSATGTVTHAERYTPYGEPGDHIYTQGPGFTSHVTDAATGLTYAQQRYYDPVIGGFLSVDPVPTNPNTGASFCRYCYANDNPYRFTDPDGRETGPAYKALYDAGNPGAPPAGPYEPPPTEGVEAVAPELYFIGGGGLRSAVGFAADRMAIRAAAGEARAVAGVVGASGKSIKAAVFNINKAGLTQKQAISALQGVVSKDARTMVDLAGANGSRVAIGGDATLTIGGKAATPAVNIAKDGTSTFGTATVLATPKGTDLIKTIIDFTPSK